MRSLFTKHSFLPCKGFTKGHLAPSRRRFREGWLAPRLCIQRCPCRRARAVATSSPFKCTGKWTRRFELLFSSPAPGCPYTRAREGSRGQRGEEETTQKTFPLAFTYFHRTSLQNTGSAASPVSCPPFPRSHGSCSEQELGSRRSSGFARRCKNVLHLRTTPAAAESPEGRALPQTPPQPSAALRRSRGRDPLHRLALPGPARPGPRRARPWTRASRQQMAGRTGSPGAERGAARRAAPVVSARRTAAAPGAAGGGAPGSPPAARGGGAEGRRGRLPVPLVYLLGQGHCAVAAAPRLLLRLLARPARSVSAGSGRRDAAIAHHTHTHTHTRTAGGGAAAAGAAAAEAAAQPCSTGAAAAQLPPRNGAAVTWGTGTSKVPLPLLLPLRHTAALLLLLLLLGALGSLTENSGQETAAAGRSGTSPHKWD